jgi:hypothetical protein
MEPACPSVDVRGLLKWWTGKVYHRGRHISEWLEFHRVGDRWTCRFRPGFFDRGPDYPSFWELYATELP